MSAGTAAAVALSMLAGLAGAVQVAVMGRFGERAGVLAALAFSLVLSTLLAAAALLVVTRSLAGFGDALRAPPWLWVGSVMGVVVVFSITIAGPRIGVVATTGLLIAAQLALATVIDRFGLFGLDRIDLGWPRLAGIVLLGAGAALSLHRG